MLGVVRRFTFTAGCVALLAFAALSASAVTLRQESFESASDGTNFVVVGQHGTNSVFSDQYFKRGGNAFFSFGQDLLSLHGASFWAGEDTDFSGPGECRVTLDSTDVRGHSNLRVTWAVAIPRDSSFGGTPYESADYLILQTALNNGAWTNVSVFRGPAGSGYLREDVNRDGIGEGTQLTRTFADFQYTIPGGLGTGVQARVLLFMSATDEEAAFDDVRITGDVIAPSIAITNPASAIAVNSAVTTYNLQGSANFGVVWNIAWSNALTGLTGTIPAATNWTIPALPLGDGLNAITVTGSNTVGTIATSSVTINRVLQPALTLTSPNVTATVDDQAVGITLLGTANTYVTGLLRWTNNLTGNAGTTSAATNWSIVGVPLAFGTNVITVTGTNILQETSTVTTSVYRVPIPAIAITNPVNGSAVADTVLSANLQGTASGEAFGLLRWTNSLTGGFGSGPATTAWTLPGVSLGLGTNTIVVTVSNIVNRMNTATVSVYRVAAPVLVITNPPAFSLVSDLVTSTTLFGTANGEAFGLRWTNSLSGASGTGTIGANWSIPGIALGFGTNMITVTASNVVNQITNATVSIYRVPAPVIAITNPPAFSTVSDLVTSTALSGTANAEAFGLLRWTNNLTGNSGSGPASTGWSLPGVGLAFGTNTIVVTVSNIVNRMNTATVSVYRVPAPMLVVTSPPAVSVVSDLVTSTTLFGTANGEAFGLRWTNSLTGGSGPGTIGLNWSIPGITLGFGTNVITVSASNIVNRSTNTTVSVYRVPAPTLTITDPAAPVTVPNGTTTRQVAGTANSVVSGVITWSNALTGATGTVPAGTNWLAAALPLAPGLNPITVRATNQVGRLASANASIAREGVVLLNEVLVNAVGLDTLNTLEFMELLHLAGGGNAGDLSLLAINGDASSPGQILRRWDLTGLTFGTNGLLLVGDTYDTTMGGAWSNQVSPHTRFADAGFVPGDLTDNSVTVLLVRNATGGAVFGADLDTNNDGVLDATPWGELVDCVGWRDSDVTDPVYCTAALAQSANWPDGASRLQTNRVPNDPSAWFNGDVITSGPDTLGRTYNPAAASTNLPAGAVLTPGRPNFPFPYDTDADGLPNAWEQQYFGGATNAAAGADSDGDGRSNRDEYWAGTDPTSAASFFEVSQFGSTGTNLQEIYTNGPNIFTQSVLQVTANVLNWDSVSNRIYEVYGRTSLVAGAFTRIQGGLPAVPPMNTYTSAIGTNRTYYHRIGVLEPVYP